MTYLLDANVFLRVLVRENEKDFRECRSLLEKIRNLEAEAVVAGVALAEITWVLGSYYRVKREDVAEKIEGILKLGGLRIVDGYDWAEAAKVYKTVNVKFLDAVLATIPEAAGKKWTVVSYDEDFKKLPVEWMKPGEALRKLNA